MQACGPDRYAESGLPMPWRFGARENRRYRSKITCTIWPMTPWRKCMQLSANQLADFATALKASDRKLPHDDRRRTPRIDVRARVIVSLIVDGRRQKPQLMRLRDLSPRGVSMMHTEDIDRGQQFILTLPREGQPPVNILCISVSQPSHRRSIETHRRRVHLHHGHGSQAHRGKC